MSGAARERNVAALAAALRGRLVERRREEAAGRHGGALFAELLAPGFLAKLLASSASAALLAVAAVLQLVGFPAITTTTTPASGSTKRKRPPIGGLSRLSDGGGSGTTRPGSGTESASVPFRSTRRSTARGSP